MPFRIWDRVELPNGKYGHITYVAATKANSMLTIVTDDGCEIVSMPDIHVRPITILPDTRDYLEVLNSL